MTADQNNKTGNNMDQYVTIDLMYVIDDMWKGFKRFFWLMPIIILIFAGGFFTIEKIRYRSTYEAFTSFAINTRTAYGYTSTYYNKAVAKQLSKTFPYILTSGALQEVVREDLDVDNLNGTISASALEDSSVFTISVTSTSPQGAYDILQSVINNYPRVAEYIIGETQLEIIDESGIPTRPVKNARYRRAVVLGGTVGVLVCLFLLAVYAATRHTVRGDEDLKNNLSLPYLGAIPHIKTKVRSRNRGTTVLMDNKESPAALGECLRTIRTRFIREADAIGAKTVLITSASEGEGKTSVAINLAISLSRQDIRVILVDADLRHPSVAKEMGLDVAETNRMGTAEVLQGKISVKEALVNYGEHGMLVLPGFEPVKMTGGLLGGKEMEGLISVCSGMCDVLIIDSPPSGMLVDASIIARKVDGTIFVIRQDYARINLVLGSIENMADTGVNILGYVLNDTERGITGYGYNYGYGYGYGYGGYGSYGQKKAKKNKDQKEVDSANNTVINN